MMCMKPNGIANLSDEDPWEKMTRDFKGKAKEWLEHEGLGYLIREKE